MIRFFLIGAVVCSFLFFGTALVGARSTTRHRIASSSPATV